MNIEQFREYCLAKKGVIEELPFGPDTLVFKVMNKMFALTSLDTEDFRVNLKADPEKAIQQREEFDFIKPGYHMNKQHWNSIYVEQGIKDAYFKELVDDSYNLIVESLPKKVKEEMQNLE